MRKCSKCKEKKGLTDFPPDKRNKSGVSSCCRKCSNDSTKKWRDANEEKYKAIKKISDRKHYMKNHDAIREFQVNARLVARYGITKEEYDAMLERQNGACALCFEKYIGSKAMHVDHCHETGRVRGILCPGCNIQLGILEKTEWVELAQAYLESHAS